MTTVAAIARLGTVHMAAESMTTIYNRPAIDVVAKIFRIPVKGGGMALLGVAGRSCAGGSLPRRLIAQQLPAFDGGPNLWAQDVAEAVTFAATGLMLVDEGSLDCSFILGFDGAVWTLTDHFAVPHADGVAAIGSGEGPAIGAIDALLAVGMPAASVVTRAVEIAINRDLHSGGNVLTETLRKRGQNGTQEGRSPATTAGTPAKAQAGQGHREGGGTEGGTQGDQEVDRLLTSHS